MVETASQWWILLKTLLSLGAVVAMIFALSWVAKKYLRPERCDGGGATGIKILQTYPVDSRKKLMIVEVQNHRVLLGVSEQSISYLCPLDSHSKMEVAHGISEARA